MKLAVLDLGSQTFHLAVFRAERGQLAVLERSREMVRLADGRHLLEPGVLGAADRLLRRALAHRCQLAVVATSAVREADDAAAFAERLRRDHGVEVEVLAGEDEARLAYLGARSSLEEPAGRVAVIDAGGGSTEVAVGDGPSCQLHASLPLGILRLRHELVPADGYVSGITARAIADAARARLEPALAPVRELAPDTVVFASGTARAVRSLAHELADQPTDDPVLTRAAIRRLCGVLAKFRPSDLETLGIDDERADTIAVGAVVLDLFLELLDAPVAWISERGLREGVALRELARAQRDQGADQAAVTRGASRPGW